MEKALRKRAELVDSFVRHILDKLAIIEEKAKEQLGNAQRAKADVEVGLKHLSVAESSLAAAKQNLLAAHKLASTVYDEAHRIVLGIDRFRKDFHMDQEGGNPSGQSFLEGLEAALRTPEPPPAAAPVKPAIPPESEWCELACALMLRVKTTPAIAILLREVRNAAPMGGYVNQSHLWHSVCYPADPLGGPGFRRRVRPSPKFVFCSSNALSTLKKMGVVCMTQGRRWNIVPSDAAQQAVAVAIAWLEANHPDATAPLHKQD